MKRTSLVLLILLAVVIGVYFLSKYIAEKKPSEVIATPVATSYIAQEVDAVLMTLRITDQDKLTFQMQRNQSGFWEITLPSLGEADIILASEAETQITNLGIVSTLGEVDSLSDFGLVNPQYIIQLVYSNGITYKLDIGDASSIGSGYYVQLDDGDVFVINQYSLDPVLQLVYNPPYPATITPTETVQMIEHTITPESPTPTP